MSTIRDDLAALCQLEARIGALTAQRDDLRRRLLDAALDTLDNEGVAPTWRAGNLGTVGLTIPKPRVEVFDEDAFAEFVAESYGEQAVVTVRRAGPGIREAVLGSITTDNAAAGVTVKARFPYLNVRLSKEAKLAAAAELGIEDEAVA